MKLESGDKVLIQAVIVRQLSDNRPDNKKGYMIRTSRGEVRVEPYEILFPGKEWVEAPSKVEP